MRAFAILASTLLISAPAAAQSCFGMPAGAGVFSWGFRGTDGATGTGFLVGTEREGFGVMGGLASMEMWAYGDEARLAELRVSRRHTPGPVAVCTFTGFERTSYTIDRHFMTRYDPDLDETIEHHRIEGEFARIRLPVGMAVGREFRQGRTLGVIPHVAAALIYEHERVIAPEGGATRRGILALGATAGLTVRVGSVFVRSTLEHLTTHDNALSGRNNFPVLSLDLGVIF